MPKRKLTYGDRALDQEVDDLWKAIGSQQAPAKQTVQETVVVSGGAASVGVASGTYGDSTDVAQITFNAQGQISAVSNVAILTLVPVVTSDPASPVEGQAWVLSSAGPSYQLSVCIDNAGTIKRVTLT